jgi:pyruvate, water dikinase
MESSPYVRWFEDIGLADLPAVGGKNAALGELHRVLSEQGLPSLGGFAVTTAAFRETLGTGAGGEVQRLLREMDKRDMSAFADIAARIRAIVFDADLPPAVSDDIRAAYRALAEGHGAGPSLAVRSSATAEDLPDASFAGQHDSFLNVRGEEALLTAVRRCFASLYTDRAISYRIDHGFDHAKVALSVGVMRMVRSDRGASGVAFTLDTESGHRDVVLLTGAFGLGEAIVQGLVDLDEFLVHKPTFREGWRAVLRRRLGDKQSKMVYSRKGEGTVLTKLRPVDRDRYCLSDEEVLTLAGYAVRLEDHWRDAHGRDVPLDIEWAKDGLDGGLYVIQARPETVTSRRDPMSVEEHRLTGRGEVIVQGRAVGQRIASGPVRVVGGVRDLAAFRPGEVLVSDTTSPDWEPVMKTAAAIVTNRGGRTCHAAIVARELGVPAVVGASGATGRLETGAVVTVSCAEGDTGNVYGGEVPFEVVRHDLEAWGRPRTKVMVNLGNPDTALATSLLPVDGVGLARMEFIIGEHIRAHPMALLHPERVLDPREARKLRRLTRHHADPADFFIEKLSEGIGTITAAFHPRPVIVRLSDFKTNEYAALLGGRAFEPVEANPMLGFRGAARYTHPAYREGFALECAALRRVRDVMGLRNLRIMVPFCRRIDEAECVLAEMAGHGLVRGRDGLELLVMCEIPSNVILIDAFSKLFDGFSIGSNDLTQLVLGVDRDSEIVASAYDERNEAVTDFLRKAVEGARRNGRSCGICGQAPSDYPELARLLVESGITSVSVTPDSVPRTFRAVLDAEAGMDASSGTHPSRPHAVTSTA